jgi:NAD(P)-dependent dehydrogenase (short-subunit alcohol dehydrogenase family)
MATYLVTGANRGIGYEYCRQLLARGDRAIAVCRTRSPELEALGVRIEDSIDLTNPASIADLSDRLSDTAIDVLINNAGIIDRVTLDDLADERGLDRIRHQFEVNALGPLRLTHALLPHLSTGTTGTTTKIILMTSRMGSIEDNTSGGSYGYRMSKVALSMAGKSLAIDLAPRGIAVAILHPGLVQTRMTNFTPHGITPTESVTGLLDRIDALTLATTGTFWHAQGDILPW